MSSNLNPPTMNNQSNSNSLENIVQLYSRFVMNQNNIVQQILTNNASITNMMNELIRYSMNHNSNFNTTIPSSQTRQHTNHFQTRQQQYRNVSYLPQPNTLFPSAQQSPYFIFRFPFSSNANSNSFFDNVIIAPSSRQIIQATQRMVFTNDTSNNFTDTTCPISLTQFMDGDELLRIRHCGHTFLRNSLLRWFETSVRCPMCRYDIREYTPNSEINIEENETETESDNDSEDENENTHTSQQQQQPQTNTNPNNIISSVLNYMNMLDNPNIDNNTLQQTNNALLNQIQGVETQLIGSLQNAIQGFIQNVNQTNPNTQVQVEYQIYPIGQMNDASQNPVTFTSMNTPSNTTTTTTTQSMDELITSVMNEFLQNGNLQQQQE